MAGIVLQPKSKALNMIMEVMVARIVISQGLSDSSFNIALAAAPQEFPHACYSKYLQTSSGLAFLLILPNYRKIGH